MNSMSQPSRARSVLARRAFLLLLAASLIRAGAAWADLPPGQHDFVIVTSNELAPEFQRLAERRSDQGLTSIVTTLDWIVAHAETGVDLQETIRHFLQAAHDQWSTRYVLLGGDAQVVPPRYAHSTFYPFGGSTEIPADLYYAGLAGDWDADGDGIWGEPYSSAMVPGDAADLEADVALGRAPVTTPAEARLFVDKTLAFGSPSTALGRDRCLVMANVLFPESWPDDPLQLDGAALAEQQIAALANVAPSWPVTRLYENHTAHAGSEPLSRASALAHLEHDVNRLVWHVGFCTLDTLEVASQFLTGADLADLGNAPEYHFWMGWYGRSAAFDGPCLIESSLGAPGGGCVGGVGSSIAAFTVTTSEYATAFCRYAPVPGARVGDALRATLAEFHASTDRNTVHRWTTLGTTLLADPTLTIARPRRAAAVPRGAIALQPAQPNPFNPTTVIAFELAEAMTVELDIYGVDGRLVRRLAQGDLPAGTHQATWHGDDASGRPVASGVYLARLRGGSQQQMTRLMLVR